MRFASAHLRTASPVIDSTREKRDPWRLLRICVDEIAGGPITVSLATSDRGKLSGKVEVEIACGLWTRRFNAQVLDQRRLAGDEVEWVLEVGGEGRRHAPATALLQLATLGDVRHLRATLLNMTPGAGKSSPPSQSAA